MAEQKKRSTLEEELLRATKGVIEFARKQKTPLGHQYEERLKLTPPQVSRGKMSSTTEGGPAAVDEAQAVELAGPVESQVAQPAQVSPRTPAQQPSVQQPTAQQPEIRNDELSELLGALVQNMLVGQEPAAQPAQEREPNLFAQNPELSGIVEGARRTHVPFLPTPEDQGIGRVMKAIAHGMFSTQQSRQAYQQAVDDTFMLNIKMNELKEQQKNSKTMAEARQMEALRHQQEAMQKQRALQSLLMLTAVPGALQTPQGEMVGRVAAGVSGAGNVFPAKQAPQDPFKQADMWEMNRRISGGQDPYSAAMDMRRQREAQKQGGSEKSWSIQNQKMNAYLKRLLPGPFEIPGRSADWAFNEWLSQDKDYAESQGWDVEFMENALEAAYKTDVPTWITGAAKRGKLNPELAKQLKSIGTE